MNPTAPRPVPTKPIPAAPAPAEGQLGVFDAVNIIVGIVIGTTIFKMAPNIFSLSGSPWGALAIWAIGGVLAFIGALCYAELATSFPRAGGDYVYLTKAFGPWAGFLFGWTQLTVVLTCSIGAMAVVFGEYASKLYDLSEAIPYGGLSSTFLYAAGAILVITLFNLIGVVVGKWTQNLLSILKIVGVLGIVVAGFGWGNWSEAGPAAWTGPNFNDGFPATAAIALILVMYAFGGWNDAAFVAAEVRDPKRNIPRALLFGVGIIVLVYLLVNVAYLVGLGFDVASQKGVPDSEKQLIPLLVLQKAFGENGVKALSVVIMISALGAVNGLIFTGSRVYSTLGNDHKLLSWLGHWKPGHGAPILALLVQAIITLTMVAAFGTTQGQEAVNVVLGGVSDLTNSIYSIDAAAENAVNLRLTGAVNPDATFDKLFAISAPFFWVFFLATGLSLFVLRDQTRNADRPFSVPLYPILPLIFCNVCVWMTYRAYGFMDGVLNLTPVFVCFVGLVLLGLPLYWLSRQIGYRDSGA